MLKKFLLLITEIEKLPTEFGRLDVKKSHNIKIEYNGKVSKLILGEGQTIEDYHRGTDGKHYDDVERFKKIVDMVMRL